MKSSSPLLECVRVASVLLAEHRKRQQLLDWCDRTDERIAQERAAMLDADRQRLKTYTLRPALPSAPRIAPRRVAPPTTPPTPREPDTFVADIASRLRHP